MAPARKAPIRSKEVKPRVSGNVPLSVKLMGGLSDAAQELIFEKYKQGANHATLLKIASNATDTKLLETLSASEHWQIRSMIASNHNTPENILGKLLNDPESKVSKVANWTQSLNQKTPIKTKKNEKSRRTRITDHLMRKLSNFVSKTTPDKKRPDLGKLTTMGPYDLMVVMEMNYPVWKPRDLLLMLDNKGDLSAHTLIMIGTHYNSNDEVVLKALRRTQYMNNGVKGDMRETLLKQLKNPQALLGEHWGLVSKLNHEKVRELLREPLSNLIERNAMTITLIDASSGFQGTTGEYLTLLDDLTS